MLVFRSPVFNPSETFVAAQAAELVRYQPVVVGLQARGSIPGALDGRVLLGNPAQAAAMKLFGAAGGLAGTLAPFGPRLVHAHFGPDALLALPLARLLGVPLVASLRGYDVTRTPLQLARSGRLSWVRYALWRRRLIDGGELFLAVSDALREQAVDAGYPAERTVTHYNGVDLEQFRPHGEADSTTILHVGRLVEKKGTAVLLRAFARLRAAHPRAALVVIGDGPQRKSLGRLAGELDVSGAVQFLGPQPADEVAEWMRRAAIVVVPSLRASDGDGEGLPNVVVEAAASGRPIVATDHGGMAEAVNDGVSGFLVPEGSVDPLAQRLAGLLDSADLRAKFGAAGRTIAQDKFDRRRQMTRLEQLYDAAVAREFTSTSATATR